MTSALTSHVAQAKIVLAEALERFGEDLVLGWTGGKDSTLALWLTLAVCREQGVPAPRCLFLDDGDVFPEIDAFVEEWRERWGLRLLRLRNDDLLNRVRNVGDAIPVTELSAENRAELARLGFTADQLLFEPESPEGNHLTKSVPLARFIRQTGARGLITAIRRDEHPARAEETFFSPRPDPSHVRVHPLLPWRERDVWEAILGLGVPFCELYRWGFRSLGARSSTRPVSDIPAWEQDLEHTSERAGRGPVKEEAMARLRSLGYM